MDDPRSESPIAEEPAEEPDGFAGGDAWPDPDGALQRGPGLEDDTIQAGDDALRWFYGGTEPPETPATAMPPLPADRREGQAQRLRRAAWLHVGNG